MTLQELADAYAGANPPGALVLDNDSAGAYQDGVKVYEAHPGTLLRELLDFCGMPWEEV